MERQRDRLAKLPSSKTRSATVAKSNFLGSKPRSATVEKADSLSSKSKIATVANPRALGSKSMSATVVVLVGIARIESLALDWASWRHSQSFETTKVGMSRRHLNARTVSSVCAASVRA